MHNRNQPSWSSKHGSHFVWTDRSELLPQMLPEISDLQDWIFVFRYLILIFLNLRSYWPEPETLVTWMTNWPSSITVPAKTGAPSDLWTDSGSPVMEDWLTIASPLTTRPSNGIMLPVRTIIWSLSLISMIGTNVSVSFSLRHTLSMCKDIALARSSTDLRWVHSSMMSPMPSKNITLPAVSKSWRIRAKVTLVASNTCTSS